VLNCCSSWSNVKRRFVRFARLSSRRCEGPFGKSDRALAFGTIGGWLAVVGSLPAAADLLMPVFAILPLATIANRFRFAMAEAKTNN
jgi:CDP-diacylglycerol---glycerol-3-phosphate 3-phosphatidyltransferase